MSFFTDYLADAKSASTQCKVNVSVILAQWAIETGTGSSRAFVSGNNFAGVSIGGGVNSFPSKAAGLAAYVQTLNQSIYNPVRAAADWQSQCIALGASAWAQEKYDNADWVAAGSPLGPWTPPHPGIDLISVVHSNNLTQYDAAGSPAAPSSDGTTPTLTAFTVGAPIAPPPLGLASSITTGSFKINGQDLDVDVSAALVTPQLDLSISQASSLILTLHDPDQILINSKVLQESVIAGVGSDVDFSSTAASFALVSVEKQAAVLTVTFEAFLVAALRTATGPVTSAAGQMSRTAFARQLVQQIQGAVFRQAPDTYLYSLNDGYDRATQEQISRGTSNAVLEDSWTCLQRLAGEIGWVCFETYGAVYFGPYSWLALQPPVMTPVIGQAGILDIDGTYDKGQPTGDLTIKATADNWTAAPGDAVLIANLGVFNGTWIVSKIERVDMMEPDITITAMQPQPNIPEPSTGGAQAAVGAGDNTSNAASQQTVGGSTAAKAALALAAKQIGKPYVWGGENPATGFDCSGLVQWCYANVGVSIPRTTFSQWGDSSIAKVPAGIGNLRPGDLVYFAGGDGSVSSPGHVAMVSSVSLGTNDVIVIDAFETGVPIRYDHFGYVTPGIGNTNFAGIYVGALRPAP